MKKGMKGVKLILSILLVSLFVSCGKDAIPWEKEIVEVKTVDPVGAEMYSYELGNRRCTTGAHEFPTVKQVCEALLDDELNNNCVENERLALYESSCLQGT